MRDFTLSKYEELIEAIVSSEYKAMAVCDYLSSPDGRCIILRHDVDRAVDRNLAMARQEAEHGIRSTYYFRHVEDVFVPSAIEEIADLGHEVGFHYEVLDKAKGDKAKALDIFRTELEDLRRYAEVTTACMHGNPFATWSNRDLWKDHDYTDFGIVGEPYFSIDYSKVLYLTDTGRTWADRNIRVKDVLEVPDNELSLKYGSKIRSTDDVIGLVRSEEVKQLCILAHPNRWCDGMLGWTKELVMQNLKNVGKAGIIQYRKLTK
ncbi:polysaccharide deacetylase family protein [Methanolobus profundi]|uniref:Polysaccharide deacetylase n=1 Tax=Methanolobus profundi TaxID=487685 RepID=A0A1I4RXM2_9EURY|nr:hypothetical protein [Methanolobus profundi]SFM56979.1 hypothetical protein SAMN04488696_1644 [Methanolobus profundi]